jgi:hypothetical protein
MGIDRTNIVLGISMLSKHGFDYHYRPDTYWDDTLEQVFQHVQGQWRRNVLRDTKDASELDPRLYSDSWAQGRTSKIDSFANLLSGRRPEGLADHAGAFDPTMLGGEFLPPLRGEEVEIARVVYSSVTQDVVSIRARPCRTRLAYRIENEYGWEYTPAIKYSRRPLTMGQLTRQLVHSSLVSEQLHDDMRVPNLLLSGASMAINHNADPERYRRWARVESSFYQIDDWVQKWMGMWIDRVTGVSPGSPDDLSENEASWEVEEDQDE